MKYAFSQREKLITFFLFLVVLLGAFYLFVFRPMRAADTAIRNEIKKYQDVILKNRRMMQKEEALKKRFRNQVDTFTQKGSDQKVMNQLSSQIEKAADQNNVHITDLKPQKVKKHETHTEFPINMSFDASLTTVMSFIHTLQQQPYMFDLNDIEIRRLSPRHEKLRCQLQLSRVFLKNRP